MTSQISAAEEAAGKTPGLEAAGAAADALYAAMTDVIERQGIRLQDVRALLPMRTNKQGREAFRWAQTEHAANLLETADLIPLMWLQQIEKRQLLDNLLVGLESILKEPASLPKDVREAAELLPSLGRADGTGKSVAQVLGKG